MLRISTLDTEYIRVPVAAKEAGAVVDPTGDTVQMAFPLAGVDPVSGDWKTASWETAGTTYYARCLVGPTGDVTLTDGLYDAWVKVTDTPEVVVRKAGQLQVV